jgi:ribosome assembly protein 1
MIECSPGAEFVAEDVKQAMVNFKTEKSDPIIAYVSKMVAIPESELVSSKKRSGATMTADEARELARRKREEIAKMQAEASTGQTDDFSRMTSVFENTSLITETEETEEAGGEKEDPEHLIGFARLYSGTLSVGGRYMCCHRNSHLPTLMPAPNQGRSPSPTSTCSWAEVWSLCSPFLPVWSLV